MTSDEYTGIFKMKLPLILGRKIQEKGLAGFQYGGQRIPVWNVIY
jgi:hypothetical protein